MSYGERPGWISTVRVSSAFGKWNSVKALRTKLVLLDEMEWQAHCAPNKTNQNNVRTNAHCNGQPININVTVNLGQNGNAMPRFSL